MLQLNLSYFQFQEDFMTTSTLVRRLPLILVVDGNPEIVAMYQARLEDIAQIVPATSVDRAMDAFARNPPFDAIVMDDLADERGVNPKTFDLTREFRGIFSGPIVITSTLHHSQLMLSAGGKEAQSYICTKLNLVDRLREILNL